MAFITATFIISLFVSVACAQPEEALVSGMPEWLLPVAERSLSAVVQNVPRGSSEGAVKTVMRKVAERLFSGYEVKDVVVYGNFVRVDFSPSLPVHDWHLELKTPKLNEPTLSWFTGDVKKIREPIFALIENLPLEALSWCDEALKEEIHKVLEPVLPGWEPSLVVIPFEDGTKMSVSFTPVMPLVIAVTPTLTSNSLPTLLNTELKEDLLEGFAPFIGIPVGWAKLHSKDFNGWTEEFLAEKRLVRQTRAAAKANFKAAQVSHVDIRVESSKYTINAWAAVYAGTSDRSAEAGVHLGRKVQIFPHWDMELYGELIMELQNWSTEGRIGLRWSPWGDVWVGGEWSTDDEMWWGRLTIDPRLHKPYAWLRLREDGEVNAALGWKATEYISFEVHYDSRDSGEWSLRMLGNM